MSTAIKFENISKQYRLGLISTQTLSHDLNRWWKMNIQGKEDPYLKIGEVNDRAHKGVSDYVWALKDINFEVQQGDVLGIIGKNGAGKSTLLKILSKVTAPTTGTIKAAGRIASLLEVGTGFHPEMTGRENIFMNGAIMGMTKAEITRKLDEIVDFSGVERYLDTPVKRYSSGMTVRLGFAIAAHLEPEILVVDEVLAVGDAEFQKKAIGKMQDVSKGEGRTVLFVSHNMAAVQSLCSKGIILSDGCCVKQGNIIDCINDYLEMETDDSDAIVNKITYLDNRLTIRNITIDGVETNTVNISNQKSSIEISLNGFIKENMQMSFELRLFNRNEIPLAIFSPGHFEDKINVYKKGSFSLSKTIEFPKNMNKGNYYADIYLTFPNETYYLIAKKCLHIVTDGLMHKGMIFDSTREGWLVL